MWSAFENFTEGKLRDPYACDGCGLEMLAGSRCFKLRRREDPRDPSRRTFIAVHNRECWAAWEAEHYEVDSKFRNDIENEEDHDADN